MVLSTEKMQKVRIIGLHSDRESIVITLHKIGVIDLRKSALQLSDAQQASNFTELSDMLIKVNGALQALEPRPVKVARHLKLEQLMGELKHMHSLDRVYEIIGERRLIHDDEELLSQAYHVATAFNGIDMDFSAMRSNALWFRAFEADKKGVSEFNAAIEKHSRGKGGFRRSDVQTIVKPIPGKKRMWLIFVAYRKGANVDDALKEVKLNELDVTAKYLDAKPAEVLNRIRARRASNAKRIHELEKELTQINNHIYSGLAVAKEALEIELSRAGISTIFKKTDSAFIVEGWIPAKRMQDLRHALQKTTSGRFQLDELHVDHHEELAPTLVNRPGFLRPFDFLMEFLSVPRSDEIDPTWIFIITFPIFYGLMVTDVGYGFASLLFSTWITKKTDPEGLMCNAAKIWQLSSVSAMLFGFLSNQYFGFQLNQYFTTFTGFDWLKDATVLIGITILFGILQVVLGLAFGAVNTWKHGEKKLSVSKVTSILTVVFGTLAVAGGFFALVPMNIALVSAGIAIVSLVLTGALSGIEAAEITNLITHPLSYARIMGFGLSSVIIALLIDQGFTPHLSQGIPLFIVYLVIFIGLHFMNMVLGIFEGLIQGVRLNVVEFFSKFYKGGGVKFRPFSYKRVYTEE